MTLPHQSPPRTARQAQPGQQPGAGGCAQRVGGYRIMLSIAYKAMDYHE